MNDPGSSTAWSGAVAVMVGGTYSGVLVASRYVLTAAHVVASAANNPSGVQVVFNLANGQTTLNAVRIEIFPGFSFPYDDVALIELAEDAPPEAARYAVLDSPISTGTTFTMVGYGDSGYGDVGPNLRSNNQTRRWGENQADVLQPTLDASGRTSAFYIYDFDGPTSVHANYTGARSLGNRRESITATGDSGSPAFVVVNGKRYLMGINNSVLSFNGSSPNFTFGSGGTGIRLSDPRFISWLRAKSSNGIRVASDPESAEGNTQLTLWAGGLLGVGLLASMQWRKRQIDWKQRLSSRTDA
ncbi:MAG: trypsin-like serine protease [Rhodocyclaceae bacterium]